MILDRAGNCQTGAFSPGVGRLAGISLDADPDRLFPQKGPVFGHDLFVFYQQTAPGNAAASIKIIISNHPEFGLMISMHAVVGDFLGLNVSVQFLLPVFQAHSQIGGPFRSPKEAEIITESLMLIELGYGSEKPGLAS